MWRLHCVLVWTGHVFPVRRFGIHCCRLVLFSGLFVFVVSGAQGLLPDARGVGPLPAVSRQQVSTFCCFCLMLLNQFCRFNFVHCCVKFLVTSIFVAPWSCHSKKGVSFGVHQQCSLWETCVGTIFLFQGPRSSSWWPRQGVIPDKTWNTPNETLTLRHVCLVVDSAQQRCGPWPWLHKWEACCVSDCGGSASTCARASGSTTACSSSLRSTASR